VQFRISSTFTDSLARLTGDEQKSVKTTAFDLQVDPVNPGMQYHRIQRCKDPNFWSIRAGRDIRVIVHKTDASLLLCYVDHHDAAYDWAERRRIERHPRTGAAQLVEVRETVREIEIPKYVEQEVAATPKPALLSRVSADDLLGYGVPEQWVDDVLAVNEDTLFELVDRLPREAAEAVLDLAIGSTPPKPIHTSEDADPFAHPDAISRFRIMSDVESLRRALDAPWDKWAVFLHPSQEAIVEKSFKGPARVCGSAGTGKTIVALHRAVGLARRHDQARVLMTTFSDSLAANLRRRLRCLVDGDDSRAGRIEVKTLSQVAIDLLGREPQFLPDDTIEEWLGEIGRDIKRPMWFLMSEWTGVIDAWQIHSWNDYRDVPRLGRRTRLGEPQRRELWAVFEQVLARLEQTGLLTEAMLLGKVAKHLASGEAKSRYAFVVVDEAQDISVSELRFVAALTNVTRHESSGVASSATVVATACSLGREPQENESNDSESLEGAIAERGRSSAASPSGLPIRTEHESWGSRPRLNAAVPTGTKKAKESLADASGYESGRLFFAGDLGQRIFHAPFSWKSLGVDVRGRSQTQKINYRTSHQIRSQADRLLPGSISDVDGNAETRGGTISVLNGPKPSVTVCDTYENEIACVAGWIQSRLGEGVSAGEVCVVVRAPEQIERATQAASQAGVEAIILSSEAEPDSQRASIATMHETKGLEFRVVVVMACDDDILPLQSRIESATDTSELEEVYNTERYLLYVACTRARDHLLITAVDPASEFLDDFDGAAGQ